MNRLTIHTEGTPAIVKVKEYVDRANGLANFWVIDVEAGDLGVEFFFRSLTAVKNFCSDLSQSIYALEDKPPPVFETEDGVPARNEPERAGALVGTDKLGT